MEPATSFARNCSQFRPEAPDDAGEDFKFFVSVFSLQFFFGVELSA
jgi:hypothetical protein